MFQYNSIEIGYIKSNSVAFIRICFNKLVKWIEMIGNFTIVFKVQLNINYVLLKLKNLRPYGINAYAYLNYHNLIIYIKSDSKVNFILL